MAGELFIGLMSGTSLDGVDATLVELSDEFASNKQHSLHVLKTHFLAYPQELKQEILALQHPTENELEHTALISNRLAHLYADTIHQLLASTEFTAHSIRAIGCHGQTIRHRPELSFTIQIGNAALLAELTGITVVSDFRSRDIAANGQGAPLVPAFHQALFSDMQHSRAIVNIGGIANITYLGNTSSDQSANVFGFDTGPGNMLLDAWIKQHLGLDYDAKGAWASTGQVIEPLLSAMLTEPYFSLPPPKSTGRDLFNTNWLTTFLSSYLHQPQDVARTLVALTAHTICNDLAKHCPDVSTVYLCGGGAKNDLLKQDLQSLLPETMIADTNALGIDVDWVEAIAFAWLAQQCLHQKTANLPSATGAKGKRILGAIYQA